MSLNYDGGPLTRIHDQLTGRSKTFSQVTVMVKAQRYSDLTVLGLTSDLVWLRVSADTGEEVIELYIRWSEVDSITFQKLDG